MRYLRNRLVILLASIIATISIFSVPLQLALAGRSASLQIIYDDALENGWQDWGWAPHNYANPTPVHSGSFSVSISPGGWQGLYLHHASFDASGYKALTFWINGGETGGQLLQVQATLGGMPRQA